MTQRLVAEGLFRTVKLFGFLVAAVMAVREVFRTSSLRAAADFSCRFIPGAHRFTCLGAAC